MIFLLVIGILFWKSEQVVQLDHRNFVSVTKGKDYLMTMAYSEGCLYSRAAMPNVNKACESLEGNGVTCGKVNVVKEPKVLPLLNITEVPSLVLFHKGKIKSIFKGKKSYENIVNWVLNTVVPFPIKISCSQLEKREKMSDFNFVLFFSKEKLDKTLLWSFAETVNQVYDARAFYSFCTDGISRPFPSLAAISNSDKDVIWFDNSLDNKVKMTKFIFDYRFSEITQYKEPLFYSVLSHGYPMMVLFLKNETLDSNLTEIYKNASRILIKKVMMTVAFPAKDEYSRKLSRLLNQELPEKAFFAIFSKGSSNELTKFVLNEEIVGTESILKFFMDFSEGSLKPYYRSQKLKSHVKLLTSNYGRITGIGFDEHILKNKKKDAIILFCYKSIPECGKAYDVFEDLAYELEHLKDLEFFRMDSLKNEVPGRAIFSVPQFRYYRTDRKEEPIFYLKNFLTIESLRDFVRDNISVIKIEKKKEDEKEETELKSEL